MAVGLQAQWDATYGPTVFEGTFLPARREAILFMQRVSMAVSAVAVTVSQEATSVVNHASRVALAKDALNHPDKYVAPFAQAMASQGLDQNSTDAALVNAVTVGWNYMAGVA